MLVQVALVFALAYTFFLCSKHAKTKKSYISTIIIVFGIDFFVY